MLVISKVFLGCYDLPMKRLIERSLPNQQPFIRVHQGETHHVQRNVCTKQMIVVAYGAEDEDEQELFRRWVARNSLNIAVWRSKIQFVPSADEARIMAEREVALWNN